MGDGALLLHTCWQLAEPGMDFACLLQGKQSCKLLPIATLYLPAAHAEQAPANTGNE
jgi:hypothetical protein